ncbi:DUF1676 domain-containing protein Osi19 [Arctopsyche grandis]|uniref:DUF1676 domain-containing protein Osi19 n=1 Tax=Arctopsyche grandis TaxID=121162 RepID=UPI00406D7B1B
MSGKVMCILALAIFGSAIAQPAKPAFWKGTPMDGLVEEMRSGCSDGNDAIACMKFKVMSLLDTIFKKDSYQVSETVEVVRNNYNGNDLTGRAASGDFIDTIQNYLQSHDVTFKLPIGGTKVTVSPRNLDDEELNVNIQFADEARSNGVEPRKSKLKKIIIPILVFVLLKAMTLVPLALGVLGLKAWNALQLSFFSFVVSVALAIFQLCKKIAADHSHPQISAHGWEAASNYRARRSLDEPQFNAQRMAYNAYAQE